MFHTDSGHTERFDNLVLAQNFTILDNRYVDNFDITAFGVH